MDVHELDQVSQKCYHARFDIKLRSSNFSHFHLDTEHYLLPLAEQPEKVSFVLHEDGEGERPDLSAGWDHCPDIREISISVLVKLREIEAILYSPKLHLRKIQLNVNDGRTDLKTIMHAFTAGGVATLESVHFVMRLPPPNTFDKLVEMNQSLRKARISIVEAYVMGQATIVERAIEIARFFFRSSNLEHLQITEYQNGRKKCSMQITATVGLRLG